MQSCPKNVLTGPLTGDSKRSTILSIAKESVPLPPVALALPSEPASATGPPSPARGSAGMPPPPSPAGATYQPPPPTPKQETLELLDLKPAEKKRQARVGKAMVRNTIASHNTTMLLMCDPSNNQSAFLNNNLKSVKREVESPKEIDQKKDTNPEANLNSKIDHHAINETTVEEFTNSDVTKDVTEKPTDAIQQVQCLKTEDKKEAIPLIPEVIKKGEEKDLLQPCLKTVAESVKVKNRKRSHSLTNEVKAENEVEASAAKKPLLQKPTCANGSYKDLIKKSTTSIKINNGKKKLVEARSPRVRAKIARMRRAANKRKMCISKEDACNNNKRLKSSKPLTASNLHNSKQNGKEIKEKYCDPELIENKEPIRKSFKKSSVNSKKTSKKSSAIVLDNLIAKNIDRTIECVVGDNNVTRTCKNIDPSALKTQDKCKVKQDVKKESVTNKKSTNSKTVAVKSSKVESRKVGAGKRKNCKIFPDIVPQTISRIPRKSLQHPRWSNGWVWEGEPYEAKVFLNVSKF